MAQMLNNFCRIYPVVNMAEHVSESLKLFKQAHLTVTQTIVSSDSGSGTIRLIRTACKVFDKRGDEKSGYSLRFNISKTK